MRTLFRILGYGKKWRWMLICSIVSLVFLTALSLVMPIAVRELLNIISENEGGGVSSSVWRIGLILLAVYALRVVLQFMVNYLGKKSAIHTMSSIRHHFYERLQQLSPRFYHDKQIGQIVYRFSTNASELRGFLGNTVPEIIVGFLTAIGVTIVLFLINPLLAVVVLAPLPLLVLVTVVHRKMRKDLVLAKKKLGKLFGALTDNLQGMKEIQCFCKQDYEYARLYNFEEYEINSLVFKGLFWVSLLKPWTEFLQGLATLAVVLAGAYFASRGNIYAADIVAFMLYVGVLYMPVANLARAVEEGTEALTGAQRIFEYIDTPSEVTEKENAIVAENLKGEIEFKNVTFGYNDKLVLNDMSFKAEVGTMVALVGETGAGKTTIGSLIARLYEFEHGSITVDGIDIRDMTLKSLRDHISVVFQDVFLFNGTISANIVYGSLIEPTHDEIVRVARLAKIHDFIDSLPDKYDTLIGERGVRLSGGQKQRLAIARALLRNCPILILDEATSSIDNITEKEIQKAIEELSKDKTKTIIVIAHRLTTIERADKILFIENGKVAEQGSHKQLMKKNGAYAKLRQGASV